MSEEDVDPYLWDRSGPPDPEVERLEELLGRHRWRPRELRAESRRSPAWLAGAAIAAGVATVAMFLWFGPRRAETSAYRVFGVEGREVVRAGEAITTGDAQSAQLEIGGLGRVDVGPNSHLEVSDCGKDAHRLYLERGSVSARILAPPRLFRIGSPAGESIDLGCAYRMDVSQDEAGASVSTLRVTTGQVAFEFEGREVYVPAGAACTSTKGRGPSAPVFEDASPEFKAAVRELEFASGVEASAAQHLVDLASREDTLTLWHLFLSKRTDPVLRRAAYDKLARVFPRPTRVAVTEEGLFVGDRAMCDAWMEEMKSAWR
jgi:hypothetical protein